MISPLLTAISVSYHRYNINYTCKPVALSYSSVNYSQLATFQTQVCLFSRKTLKTREERQRKPERPEGEMTLSAKVNVLLFLCGHEHQALTDM